MMTASRVRAALASLSLCALAVACSEPPKPPPPAPPVVAYVPPPITLSSRVTEQAAAYRGYVAKAAAISSAFQDGAQVAGSVKTGAAYEPNQLYGGAVAYAAVVALQDPAFVTGVRSFAADANQRLSVRDQIIRDPAYAAVIPGAASAAGLVIAALADDGLRVLTTGRAVKQAAYDVQRSKWSKDAVSLREARLIEAKTLSATPLAPAADEALRLQQAYNGAAPLGLAPATAAPPYTPTVIKGLALAALAALGEAGDDRMAQIAPLLADPSSNLCLNMSKLNLYQCLAVAKPHYEDIFCLGEHALIDTGVCLVKASGAPVPMPPPPPAKVADKAPAKPAAKKKTAKKG